MKKVNQFIMLIFAAQLLMLNACKGTEVDEKAVKQEADETAGDLLDKLDDSFTEDSTANDMDTLNQP